jgi:hypothetical protein
MGIGSLIKDLKINKKQRNPFPHLTRPIPLTTELE